MSLIVTLGLGSDQTIGSAFVTTGVNPALGYVDITFSKPVDTITGPAAIPSQYAVTPTGGGSPVQVLAVAVVGGNVRLTTTECTDGASYQLTMPWVGFDDGLDDALQGPFTLNFTGVGQAPYIVMSRTVDARLMEVVFSEPMVDAEALDWTQYSTLPALTLSGATKITDVVYRLTTSRQVRDLPYAIWVSGSIHDQHGNPVVVSPPVPSITSLSETEGTVGDTVVISGTNFYGVTDVDFNGTSASFVVNDPGQITCTVPVGATSGPLHVVNAYGTASAAFIVVVAFDFTTLSGAGALTFSRTGADMILPRSASTAARVAAGSGTLFQDYGNGMSGAWSLIGHTNLTATDLALGAWTPTNLVTAASPVTDPLGTTAAGRVTDSVNALSVLRATGSPFTTGITKISISMWAADVSGNAPTAPGAFSTGYPAGSGTPYLSTGVMPDWASSGPSFGSGTTWRRITTWFNTSNSSFYDIRPVGEQDASYATHQADVGALDLFALSWAVSNADVPAVLGATSAVSPTLTGSSAGFVSGGVLSARVGAFNMNYDVTSLNQGWLWSGASTDGYMGVRYTPTTDTWELFVRGVSVLSCTAGWNAIANQTGYSYTGETVVDVGYDTGANKSYIRVWVGGCVMGEATGTTTGSPLAAPSTVYFGSRLATDGYMNLLHTFIKTAPAYQVEGLTVGDSILAWSNVSGFSGSIRDMPTWGSFIYTNAQARAKAGIGSCAHAGDTVAAQQAAFDTWVAAHDTSGLKWALIQVGINDIITGGATETALAASLNTLTAHIRATLPSVKIIINRMLPSGSHLSGPQLAVWTAVNLDIDGTGTHPITNVDYRVSANSTVLDDGSGNMLAAYTQDGTHPNCAGKKLAAAADVAALTSLGFLP